LSHDSGWYGSLWGSNIEFGDGSLELDLSAGWAKDWDNGLTTDLGVIRYQYSQDDTDLSYNEIYAVVSYADAKLGLVYSPDYFGENVDDFQYVYASYEPQLFSNVSLVLHLGSNFFASQQDMALFLGSMAASNSHYLDWRVGLNLNMTEQDVLSVGYVDTDLSQSQCQSLCDARWIVSLSRSF
ncbi:MAG: TorF family putative porin, partial [Shewanella sp.]|nr:TorF family putative porin [Shewanella sp.]